MRLIPLFVCAILTRFVLAQAPVDDTPAKAFEMTKATVEFLATDKKTYGYQAKETCENCVSYEQLAAYIKTNRLTKADELVRDAKKKTDELIAQKKAENTVLAELKKYLIERVTDGADRKHRFMLKSFPAYQRRLNQLAGLADIAAEDTSLVSEKNGENPQMTADTVITNDLTADTSANAATTTTTDLFSMTGLALLLSLVSLVGVIFLFIRKPKVGDARSSDTTLAQLSDKVFHLEADRKELVKAVQTLTTKVQHLEGQLRTLTTTAQRQAATTPVVDPLRSVLEQPANGPMSPNPPVAQNRPRTHHPEAGNVARNSQPPVTPQLDSATMPDAKVPPAELYARTADLGDGFSISGLLQVPERGTIYQLTIEENQAAYRVVDAYDAQQLALSDPYSYLSDACEYQNQPRTGARIQTDQLGRLSLQGEKWKIEQKAKISFV